MSTPVIRQPQVAGTFYPSSPGPLRATIERFLAEARPPDEPVGNIVGIISPHAGYVYSGGCAAHGFSRLARRSGSRPDTIVVISPSHREFFPFVSVYSGDYYRTPLGDLPVDASLRERLLLGSQPGLIKADVAGHRAEHALEVQLPFLQVIFGEIPLLPIVMGDQSAGIVQAFGRVLGEICKARNIAIVASSDLSHFHHARDARRLDSVFTKNVELFDASNLLSALEDGSTEACGGGPAAAMLMAAGIMGATNARVLEYRHSGDVTGDNSSVVGYCSAIVYH